MKITMLGTGHGNAINCYNTCFVIDNGYSSLLVDSGGGNGILKQLNKANISTDKIKQVFISHTHIDHILGVIWIIRTVGKKYFHNENESPLYIYGNKEVTEAIKKMCKVLLPKDFNKLIDTKIKIINVVDKEQLNILNKKVEFFDLRAKKAKQFGFTMWINDNDRFTFIGDEACSSEIYKYIRNSKWLFADSYMCGEQAETYNPIEKHHHSSVKYISIICENLNVENLILSHTMDDNLKDRKQDFTNDSKLYFRGNVYVPNDLEEIII